jgi:hypothetical protein
VSQDRVYGSGGQEALESPSLWRAQDIVSSVAHMLIFRSICTLLLDMVKSCHWHCNRHCRQIAVWNDRESYMCATDLNRTDASDGYNMIWYYYFARSILSEDLQCSSTVHAQGKVGKHICCHRYTMYRRRHKWIQEVYSRGALRRDLYLFLFTNLKIEYNPNMWCDRIRKVFSKEAEASMHPTLLGYNSSCTERN